MKQRSLPGHRLRMSGSAENHTLKCVMEWKKNNHELSGRTIISAFCLYMTVRRNLVKIQKLNAGNSDR